MTFAAFGPAMSSLVVVVPSFHLHGYASISLANNSLEKETSYRASKLLEGITRRGAGPICFSMKRPAVPSI